jgi:3-oxoadipate enol-lactonase
VPPGAGAGCLTGPLRRCRRAGGARRGTGRSASRHDEGGATAPLAPFELSALERGGGEPITLIHGGGFHSGPAWARQIGPLAEAGYRVIAVDRRGFGRSPAGAPEPGELVPVALQAEDVRTTLDLREVGQTHVVAISYGALVALELATRRPERVRSLTLVEPALFSWLADDEDYAPWFERFVELESAGAAGTDPKDWLDEWLGLIDPKMAQALAPGTRAREILERALPHQLAEESAATYRPDIGRLAALGIPAMVVNGADSEPALHAVGQALAGALPGSRHVLIPGAGHQVHAEATGLFNELLLAFLDTQPIGAGEDR